MAKVKITEAANRHYNSQHRQKTENPKFLPRFRLSVGTKEAGRKSSTSVEHFLADRRNKSYPAVGYNFRNYPRMS
jgi:hypothetical protein